MGIQLGRYWRLLSAYLKPQRPRVTLLTILLISGIAIQLVNPQAISYFIDTAQSGGPLNALLSAATLFIVLALLQRLIMLGSTYVAENVGWSATNALRADLALHCLQLDMSFHKKHTVGELIERIDGDVTALANFFSQFIIQVLGNALLVLGVLFFLWREDWRVGIGLTIYTILTFLILSRMQNIASGRWLVERQASADHYSFLEEHLTGTEDIRAAGAEPYVTQRLYRLMRAMLESTRSARLVSNLTYVSTRFLYVVGYTIGLALGAYLYIQGQVSIGSAYLIVFYIGMLATPLESIRDQFEDLQEATASIERVEELFKERSQLQQASPAAVLNEPISQAAALAFQEVTFSYEGETNVLQEISFNLQAGKVLGVLGRTGSGKTTLARLLFRLYDPGEGHICINGLDTRKLSIDEIRQRVGIVTQDVQLFQASIRDNLTFFNPRIDDAQIQEVLQELDLWKWIETLPNGLDTRLDVGGQGLSAGEGQLLAFARVFLKNPGIVILDEASSRLDPATETLLERAIERLLQGRTGIIIAHRLQTVQRVDEILILEEGQIVEYGERAELAHNPDSRFYSLLQSGLEEVQV